MSSASVRFFLSLTQNTEQSKLTNPHCVAFSAVMEETESGIIPTLWRLIHRESANLLIAGKRQCSLYSGQAKVTPAQAASIWSQTSG